MISITLCMIVKNEQSILERCLISYAGTYDELIIVDTGSTDSTKDIAQIKYMIINGVTILPLPEITHFH